MFTINLDAPAPAGGLQVGFNTTGSSAANSDYTLIAGSNISALTANSLVLAAGATTAQLLVQANADGQPEAAETLALTLSASNSGAVSFVAQQTFYVGSTPISVSVGDVNGDGRLDVLTANGADKLHGLNMADNLAGGLGNDTLWGGYGDDNLFGEDGHDKLLGEQENDYLDGGAGNDWLEGGEGLDTMIGGTGNDTYILGFDAIDVITDNSLSTDVDTVIMPYQLTKYTLPVGIEQGTIAAGTQASSLAGNASNNTLTGNDGKNTLTGAVGRDSLFGGLGNDVLNGGTGNDALTGGTGKDTFLFNSAITANTDKITDFKPVDDTIKLENQIFTKLTVTGVLNASQFVKGANALDPNDYVIYNPATGAVTYDADGSGAGFGVQIRCIRREFSLDQCGFCGNLIASRDVAMQRLITRKADSRDNPPQ